MVDTAAPVDRDLSTRPEIDEALAGRIVHAVPGARRPSTTTCCTSRCPSPRAGRPTARCASRSGTHELNERVNRFWLGVVRGGGPGAAARRGRRAGPWPAGSAGRVRRLATTAERFATGDLSPEPEQAAAPTEIAALQRHMNEMAARLDAQLAQQRAFVADASHQLRTPLTALRLRLENTQERLEALSEPASDDPDLSEHRAELAAAVAEVDRLSELVSSLLRLARAEQGCGVTRRSADLGELTRDRVDTWAAVGRRRGGRPVLRSDHPRASRCSRWPARGAGAGQPHRQRGGRRRPRPGPGPGSVSADDAAGPWLKVSDDGPGPGR